MYCMFRRWPALNAAKGNMFKVRQALFYTGNGGRDATGAQYGALGRFWLLFAYSESTRLSKTTPVGLLFCFFHVFHGYWHMPRALFSGPRFSLPFSGVTTVVDDKALVSIYYLYFINICIIIAANNAFVWMANRDSARKITHPVTV